MSACVHARFPSSSGNSVAVRLTSAVATITNCSSVANCWLAATVLRHSTDDLLQESDIAGSD
jgi:hypothetical protein